MAKSVARNEPRPRGGLESWLVRKIHTQNLRSLPSYKPLNGRTGQNAEQYARRLLAALRDLEAEPSVRERTRDDGRAFRSWVEALASAPSRRSDQFERTSARWAEA
ncbi:MAG: hypothetical protein KGM43_09880 [Planctomycetota bacterium]|nr:hypothetical protein [Planctomycetota bacterium]